jgi:hypothetical protein
MSGLNVIPTQDSITAYVRQEFPNYQVYDDDLLDDEAMLKVSNKVKPYIVLRWGGLFRQGGSTAISGVRNDEYISTVDVAVIAPTPRQCRVAISIIMDKLIGWTPAYSSPMVPDGSGGAFVVTQENGSPHLYLQTDRLSFAINAENVGSHITP